MQFDYIAQEKNAIFSFQLIDRFEKFRYFVSRADRLVLRSFPIDVDLANCPSAIDANLCVQTANNSAILLCNNYLNKVSILINPKERLNLHNFYIRNKTELYIQSNFLSFVIVYH